MTLEDTIDIPVLLLSISLVLIFDTDALAVTILLEDIPVVLFLIMVTED